jgi:hypothetical protein
MGERLLGKYRGLYRRAMEVLSEWEGTQARARSAEKP